ncbi:MAG: hypothetical protein KJ600_06455 [Nanoarchaeota archaeon]|nr:hypothetical protein [Nanoarchaeota archaeon]MBU1104166.1 hypothetical protein [Nanoarchaeota archaeon]
MNILFVCRYNRFRSVLAEGLFRKHNKKHKVKSAGLIVGSPIDANTKQIAKDLKIKIKKNPEPLSSKLFGWQDLIIIVADNVPLEVFRKQQNVKRLKLWEIKDTNNDNERKPIANKIEKKIRGLIEEIK